MEELECKHIQILFNLAKAFVLSTSVESQDRIKAKELFESVITENEIEYKYALTSILKLCELIIIELRESEDIELLEELKTYVKKIHKEGSAERAYPILVQSTWLQANIALLELDVNKARYLLNIAQEMAEAKELYDLARRISNSYDVLLFQLNLWDHFTMQLPSIAERMELTHIESVLDEMIRGRGIVFSEGKSEKDEPIIIAIFAESGSTLFLHQFDQEISAKLVDEIWSAIINRIQEEKDKRSTRSIERMMFKDYLCLVKRLKTLFFCYIIFGNSYEGIKKLEEFSQLVYGTIKVWEELEELSKFTLSPEFDISTITDSNEQEEGLHDSSRFLLHKYVKDIFQ